MVKYIVVVVFVLLASCSRFEGAGPFPVVGKFDDYNETITGEVRIDYDRAVSYITARTRESKLSCDGLSRVIYRPPAALDCRGYQGTIRLQCSGGRTLTGDWRARACNAGDGTGWITLVPDSRSPSAALKPTRSNISRPRRRS
jgi:hypothetical protein